MNDDETREQVEEDAKEDLELEDDDAENVTGGTEYQTIKLEPTEQKF